MPVFTTQSKALLPMPSQSVSLATSPSRSIAIKVFMSSLVNVKMFFCFVIILSNCLSWSVNLSVSASTLGGKYVKNSHVIGDIAETRKFSENAFDNRNDQVVGGGGNSEITYSTPKPSVKDFNSHLMPAAAATGSASSRFNVDLRGSARAGYADAGPIQSPTTFIGSGHHLIQPHHELRKKTQGSMQSLSVSLLSSSATAVEATKSEFDEKRTCPPYYFTCNDGQCIPMRWKCDSKSDCHDGSDETIGCANASRCNEGQFQCVSSHKCIPNNWVCDGEYDCDTPDVSDELNCHSDALKCRSYQRECSNGICLDISKFCDGNWDCDNDEVKCDNQDALCATLNCSFNCKLTPQGPTCYCAPGQVPVNVTQCEDFDECTIEGMCDQMCVNTPGSYECNCVSGYVKQKNRCLAVNVPKDEAASLIFLTQTDVRRINPNDGTILNLLDSTDISAIEIWHRNRTLCAMYASPRTAVDMKCNRIDDLNVTWSMPLPELISSTHSIDKLRLDWITGNWYFLSNEPGLIFMCTNTMEYCSIILKDVQNPSSMVLDPTKGFIFFTEWSPSLSRANLDGSNLTALVSTRIYYPSRVTLDLPNEHVYWIDIYKDFVERVDYEGRNRWSMKKTSDTHVPLKSLHAVEVFENSVYLAPWSDTIIVSMDKFSLKAKQVAKDVKRPYDFRIFHRQKQPEVAHPCRANNGLCNQICVPLWTKGFARAACMCSHGYKLRNNTECELVRYDKFLILARQRLASIAGIPLNQQEREAEAMVPIYNVTWIMPADINVHQKLVYYVQQQK